MNPQGYGGSGSPQVFPPTIVGIVVPGLVQLYGGTGRDDRSLCDQEQGGGLSAVSRWPGRSQGGATHLCILCEEQPTVHSVLSVMRDGVARLLAVFLAMTFSL